MEEEKDIPDQSANFQISTSVNQPQEVDQQDEEANRFFYGEMYREALSKK